MALQFELRSDAADVPIVWNGSSSGWDCELPVFPVRQIETFPFARGGKGG